MCDQIKYPLARQHLRFDDTGKAVVYCEICGIDVPYGLETRGTMRARCAKHAEDKPKYDNLWITCHCGNKIGGTVIRDKHFSFTCLTCGFKWAGQLEEVEVAYD